jgi:hypothetical protein
MKTVLALLLFCALLPTASAQGGFFSNVLRGVTGAVGGKEAAPATSTATLGVRGVDDGDVKVAAPVAGEVRLLESWAVGRKEAEAAAARRGLAVRVVHYGTETAAPNNPGTTQGPK